MQNFQAMVRTRESFLGLNGPARFLDGSRERVEVHEVPGELEPLGPQAAEQGREVLAEVQRAVLGRSPSCSSYFKRLVLGCINADFGN